jgi:hypothetical protein
MAAQMRTMRPAMLWLVGAAATGLVVGVVAELLVGEESGGGAPGATSMALDVGLGAFAALIALAVVAARRSALSPAVITTNVLAVIALALAWYSPIALVLGATASGLAVTDESHSTVVARAGTTGRLIAALWLVVFIGIVVAELLRGR